MAVIYAKYFTGRSTGFSWKKSTFKPEFYFVSFNDPFFGLTGDNCYAVVDDFGDLVRVPS